MKKEELLTAIKSDVACIEQKIRQDISGLRNDLDPLLYEILEYGVLDGGKRIRPLLTVLSGKICGCSDDSIYRLAIAFEYLHVATLFHDDVIDNAENRRGRQAVCRKFGNTAAILAGDFLHARSMDIIGEMTGRAGLSIFCAATASMVDGEFKQLRNLQKIDMTADEYYEIVTRKTGLLISAACQIGALFANASQEQSSALKKYGISLGIAFQIIDDWLDFQGDAQKTGKVLGNDFLEGKLTLPSILAYIRATSQDQQRFETMILDQHRISYLPQFINLIESYGGFAEAKEKAHEYIQTAKNSLSIFHTDGNETKEKPEIRSLNLIADFVIYREK